MFLLLPIPGALDPRPLLSGQAGHILGAAEARLIFSSVEYRKVGSDANLAEFVVGNGEESGHL